MATKKKAGVETRAKAKATRSGSGEARATGKKERAVAKGPTEREHGAPERARSGAEASKAVKRTKTTSAERAHTRRSGRKDEEGGTSKARSRAGSDERSSPAPSSPTVDRRTTPDRRTPLDRRVLPPRPEGRRRNAGRRATDPQD